MANTDNLWPVVKDLLDKGAEVCFSKGKAAVKAGSSSIDEAKDELKAVLPSDISVDVSPAAAGPGVPVGGGLPGGTGIMEFTLRPEVLEDGVLMSRLVSMVQEFSTSSKARLVITTPQPLERQPFRLSPMVSESFDVTFRPPSE